jgi:hypothetical protein
MAPPKFRSPFAPLALSSASGADLRRLAHGLVADAVDEYEHFLWRQHGTVDAASHWSLVREQDDVRVYQQKQSKPKMRELLVVGTVQGELDDALYGALGRTTDALRLCAGYTKDRVANGAVLTTLTRPSREKPFRSLTIKWLVRARPGLHAVGKKKTDMVVLDCTGTKALSNGETVGFQLVHSVDLHETPSIPRYERASLSQCTLWRQTSDDRVQLYARAFVAETGSARATGDALLALARSPHCAQMKKLAWLMRCKAASLNQSHTGSRSSSSSAERICEICPTQLFSLQSSGSRRTAKAACAVCSRLVCSSCHVKRELCTVVASGDDKQLLEERVAFCAPCHAIAMRAAAADVASEEAARESERQPFPSNTDDAQVVVMPGEPDDDDESSCGDPSSEDGGALELDRDDDVDRYRRLSFRKSKPSSSIGGTLEDDEMANWSPAARHRAGTELQALCILGDA